jgi:hypothetical protein
MAHRMPFLSVPLWSNFWICLQILGFSTSCRGWCMPKGQGEEIAREGLIINYNLQLGDWFMWQHLCSLPCGLAWLGGVILYLLQCVRPPPFLQHWILEHGTGAWHPGIISMESRLWSSWAGLWTWYPMLLCHVAGYTFYSHFRCFLLPSDLYLESRYRWAHSFVSPVSNLLP